MTDKEIIKIIRSDDRVAINNALRVLYRANFGMVKTLVLKTHGRQEDAADTFQSAMLIVYEQVKSGQFLGNSSLKTYLYAISRNLWFKTLKQRSSEVNIDDFEELLSSISVVEVENLVIAYEKKLTFSDLLEQLGEGCKKVLKDFYYRGLTLEEVARRNDLKNDATAKNKKYRCMARLMTLIKAKNISMQDLEIEDN